MEFLNATIITTKHQYPVQCSRHLYSDHLQSKRSIALQNKINHLQCSTLLTFMAHDQRTFQSDLPLITVCSAVWFQFVILKLITYVFKNFCQTAPRNSKQLKLAMHSTCFYTVHCLTHMWLNNTSRWFTISITNIRLNESVLTCCSWSKTRGLMSLRDGQYIWVAKVLTHLPYTPIERWGYH